MKPQLKKYYLSLETKHNMSENPAQPTTKKASVTNTAKTLDEILQSAIENKASDVHLSHNMPPTIRVSSILQPLPGYDVLTSDDIASLVTPILSEKQLNILFQEKELDTSYQPNEKSRFRVNIFFERGHMALAARYISSIVPTIDSLNLPPVLYEFTKLPKGLVLITGPTGAGKSTTLAAIINRINTDRNAHIVTIEDPIEFSFQSKKSLVQQREMHADTLSWDAALRSVLREDPNIILIGELRDQDTIQAALTAAETGHLVLTTLHTNSAAQTIDRIIGVFPAAQQTQIMMQLSTTLEGVVSQTLTIGKDGVNMYPAIEILLATSAVRNIIRENKTHQINNVINTSYDMGMISLERSLADLVSNDLITLEEATSKTLKPNDVIRYVKQK